MRKQARNASSTAQNLFRFWLATVGYAVAYFAATTEDTRVFYPIAGAIAGWILGALVFDSLRKKRELDQDKATSAT